VGQRKRHWVIYALGHIGIGDPIYRVQRQHLPFCGYHWILLMRVCHESLVSLGISLNLNGMPQNEGCPRLVTRCPYIIYYIIGQGTTPIVPSFLLFIYSLRHYINTVTFRTHYQTIFYNCFSIPAATFLTVPHGHSILFFIHFLPHP